MKLISLMLVLPLCSCVMMRSEGDQIQSDISRLKDQIATLQREQYDSLNQIDHIVKEVKLRTSTLENTAMKQNANADLDKDRLISEVQELRGKLEETQHRLENVNIANHQDTAVIKDSKLEFPEGKSNHFVYAKSLYDGKKYSEAIIAFTEFVKKYNDDKQFMSQAYFFLGDSYYESAVNTKGAKEKEALYKKAVLTFQDVLTQVPPSSKVPEALFKVGNAMEAMGFFKDAIVFYEEIVSKHKKSSLVKA
ncbi:MAG: tetratricopeptide repeat protein, partial [bacterium]|nr:tetratricopeptide repeat protein [bacterium]